MTIVLPPGTTSYSMDVQILDDAGLPVTGLLAATFPAVYYSTGTNVAATSVTLSDLSLITSSYSSGGVKERSGGYYRFDPPNASLSSGLTTTIIGEASGKRLIAPRLQVQKIAATIGANDIADIPTTRAAKIDNADVATSSRLAPTVAGHTVAVSAAGIVDANLAQLGGVALSGAGRGLNNLDADYYNDGYLADSPTLATILAAIGNLNNLSALANITGPGVMEIPDSTTAVYQFGLTIKDTEGHLVDLDSLPTLTAMNASGTSRAGNFSAPTKVASSTGRYTFTYSVTSSATKESLIIAASGTQGGVARYAELGIAVVDFDSQLLLNAISTTSSAIKAKTDLLSVGGSGYIPVDILAIGGNSSRATILAGLLANYAIASKLAATVAAGDAADITTARLAKIDGSMQAGSYTAPDNASASAAASSAAAAVTAIGNITSGGAVKLPTTPPAGYGGFQFAGARAVTITAKLPDTTTGAAAAIVRVTQGSSTQVAQANNSGLVAFSLDDGSYVVSISKDGGYSFTPATIAVDSTHLAFTCVLSSASAPQTPAAGQCRGTLVVLDKFGAIEPGAMVEIEACAAGSSAGLAYDSTTQTVAADSNGQVIRLYPSGSVKYRWRRGTGPWIPFLTAATDGVDFLLPSNYGPS